MFWLPPPWMVHHLGSSTNRSSCYPEHPFLASVPYFFGIISIFSSSFRLSTLTTRNSYYSYPIPINLFLSFWFLALGIFSFQFHRASLHFYIIFLKLTTSRSQLVFSATFIIWICLHSFPLLELLWLEYLKRIYCFFICCT